MLDLGNSLSAHSLVHSFGQSSSQDVGDVGIFGRIIDYILSTKSVDNWCLSMLSGCLGCDNRCHFKTWAYIIIQASVMMMMMMKDELTLAWH